MRQAPYYAIIGNGRMANHMCCYLRQLSLPFGQWHRSYPIKELHNLLRQASHALILINDDAIESFIDQYIGAHYSDLLVIHFSGCLTIRNAHGAHPLQSFGKTLYSLAEYQKIPFFIAQDGPDFAALLPGLNNPHYGINVQDKPYYHTLCVLANNLTTLLWQKFFQEMIDRFGIQKEDLYPYLNCTFHNLAKDPFSALTGPFARKDKTTLKKNIQSLQNDPFQPIFQSFIHQFFGETNEDHY